MGLNETEIGLTLLTGFRIGLPRMALFGFELEEIARLIALVETQGLDEFIYEAEGRYLRIRGPRSPKLQLIHAPVAPFNPSSVSAPPAARSANPRPTLASEKLSVMPAADQVVLASPMVGVFYRAEKPGADPLVNVGDRISVGQVVGVLEAMKVFSEFKAEHAGVIVAIPAQDGQLVQAEMPLFILKKEL